MTRNICLLTEFRTCVCPREPGVATLISTDTSFCACALLQDAFPFNPATQDNQRLWLLGDVFELFLQLPGQEDYYEFHSTPEGCRLQLHIPDCRTFRTIPHEQKICDAGLTVKNRIDRLRKLWYCELRVPFEGLGLEKCPESVRFAFVRYNLQPETAVPEITTYPFFPVTVHAPSLWAELKFRLHPDGKCLLR